MPALIVAGITVPVAARNGARKETEEIGDRARAFDGTMRSVRTATARRWHIVTAPMSRADADTLEAALIGAPPLACSGDILGGAVDCVAELLPAEIMPTSQGQRVTLQFILHEI